MTQDKTKPAAPAPVEAPCKPQKILVPVDFSENGRKALPYAGQFAAQFGARLYLVHVVEPMPFLPDLRDNPLALSEKEVMDKAKEELEELAGTAFPSWKDRIELIVRQGKAHQQITSLAGEQGMDLIIMATKGYTGLEHTLLGSTTERVVRYAPCPVLVVRS
jgi:nucleotide-binding universal stress UspA family protein